MSLDEKLSIIDIKWARNGKKFVAGTSSKWIYVAWEDEKLKAEGIDWNSVKVKVSFDSSILSVSFDPTGRVIAATSFDGNCKIISAYYPEIDTVDQGIF